MRTLYVKETTRKEVAEKWGFSLPRFHKNPLFIRCNKEGEVNWEKNSLYSEQEIKRIDNVYIHSKGD